MLTKKNPKRLSVLFSDESELVEVGRALKKMNKERAEKLPDDDLKTSRFIKIATLEMARKVNDGVYKPYKPKK